MEATDTDNVVSDARPRHRQAPSKFECLQISSSERMSLITKWTSFFTQPVRTFSRRLSELALYLALYLSKGGTPARDKSIINSRRTQMFQLRVKATDQDNHSMP